MKGFGHEHVAVQSRSVKALLSYCLSKDTVDDGVVQFRALWAGCKHTSCHVHQPSCDAIVSLVKNGKIALETAFAGFLDILPGILPRNVEAVVSAVFQLTRLQIVHTAGTPYTLRAHPMISMVTHRPESTGTLLSLLGDVSSDELALFVPVVHPLARFAFASTRNIEERTGLRTELFTWLLQRCATPATPIVHELSVLPCLALLSSNETASASLTFARKLVDCPTVGPQLSEGDLHAMLAMCMQCLELGFAVDQSMRMVR